jgi:hypothetical protein
VVLYQAAAVRIGPEMLAVVTRGGNDVRLRSLGQGRTLILVFES